MVKKETVSLFKTLLFLSLLPIVVFAVKTVLDIRRGASGVPANIVVDASAPQGNIPSSLWRNLSQGGEEPTDMIRPVISLLRPLQPQLIRVDHLFDYYQVETSPGNYDFSRLDEVVTSIIATGAKPMLSLSYTTADMSKTGQNAGEPKDWNQWYQLVRATARRYSVEKKISGIYYEVWNEPDLFGGWHYGKNPNYSTLYTKSAQAVADGAGGANYKIGGPATTAYYSNWIKSLFKTAKNNRLRLDFISWHKYSKNLNDYQKEFDNLNSILSDYPQYFNIERTITEIGPNPEPDPWYDSKESGVHLIALSTRLAGKIHRLFTFEPVDGPSPRSSVSTGWGIITHSNNGLKPKPRYYAIEFLNKLQGQRLPVSGEGSWVTALASKNPNGYQILLVNYDQNLTHAETFPLTINNLAPGKYTLKNTPYLGKTTQKTITVDATSTYKDNIFLDANSAILLELNPQ